MKRRNDIIPAPVLEEMLGELLIVPRLALEMTVVLDRKFGPNADFERRWNSVTPLFVLAEISGSRPLDIDRNPTSSTLITRARFTTTLSDDDLLRYVHAIYNLQLLARPRSFLDPHFSRASHA